MARMGFSKVQDAPKFAGKRITLRGWVYRQRAGKNVAFIVLRDASGTIQCTVKEGNPDFGKASSITVESSVELHGKIRKDERAPGGYELEVEKLNIIQKAERFPITKDQSVEWLLDTRHLWLRSQKLTNVLKVRQYVMDYMREWFKDNDFWEVQPPILTQAGCEGGSTLFKLKYFDDYAYLTQSGQLYNEVFTTSLERIFVFAPSFRAEKSRTTRHLAEYWHLEEEAAFVDNEGNMEIQEGLVSHACQKLAKEHPDLLEFFGRDPRDLLAVKPPFDRMSYDEAIEAVQKKGGKIKWGEDMGTEEERLLTQDLKAPLFVYNYPAHIKAFYMRIDPENPKTVLCDDLLAPEGHGEIIGGSERIWELGELLQAIKDWKLDPKDYGWYIDLRKYGSVPHSGFGLGFERIIKWILRLEHIRDAIAFPRTINRVKP
jgi:asparaginyl-tRNA synthetase